MDEVPAENQRALENMNWDDRLREARAKREAVLRAKAAQKSADDDGSTGQPAGVSLRTVETLRFGSELPASLPSEDASAIAAPATKQRYAAVLAVGFCAGFAAAVGLWALQGQLGAASNPIESPSIAEVTPLGGGDGALPEAPKQFALLADELLPLAPLEAPIAPGQHESGERIAMEPVSLVDPRAEGLPNVGPAALSPAPAFLSESPQGLSQGGRHLALAAEVQNLDGLGAKSAGPLGGAWSDHLWLAHEAHQGLAGAASEVAVLNVPLDVAPIRPDPVLAVYPFGTPAVPAVQTAGVTVASFDPTPTWEGGSLGANPDPGPLPRADQEPPRPFLPGAEDLAVRVFAARDAQSDRLETSAEVLAAFGLPLSPINQVSFRISQNQVRFYDDASADAARILANKLNAIPRDFTGAAARPPSGTLEIYLAGPATRSDPTVARVAPLPRPQINQEDRLRQQVLSKLRAGPSG